MVLSENAASILLDLTLLNHWLFCKCVSQDLAVQCFCVSQELAQETSESLCMVAGPPARKGHRETAVGWLLHQVLARASIRPQPTL